jgi:tetratricopeptide (TPR) repeat protein
MANATAADEKDTRKVCFVVMGFGKKTDFETGRTLDLNATYEAIIEPAVTNQGLRCIRADEIVHSGVIDVEMYDQLLRADLVIADISTGNVNAVYELGVRHALRPNSTIIMTEDKGKLYFDLNHTSTFKYSHFGEDIGAREVKRAVPALEALIAASLTSGRPDSPVYTYLPRLQQPKLTDEQYAELLDEAEAAQQKLFHYMHEGERLLKASDHAGASKAFASAEAMKPGEPDIIQKLALTTYKAMIPTEVDALLDAGRILDALDPAGSNDPETLGIAGAIRKRLWSLTKERHYLDLAIRYYGRGYEVRRDYYTGENLALCLEYRALIQNDSAETKYDFMSAHKARVAIVEALKEIVAAEDFYDRPDKRWVYATLSNALLALGNIEQAEKNENHFRGAVSAKWEEETFDRSKAEILSMKSQRAENA